MESSGEDGGRVKLLCSYGGSILPRPHDGRLRYVGGDTRIVILPRDVSYADLLCRMQELFEGVSIIKYQQPDEDLDALVSVVNDDDVMSMMEEYDKLGTTGDGCTRLRIFLFSACPEMDAASVAAYYDADDRETERRYVDALNSVPETKSPASPDMPEQQFGHLSLDAGIGNQVNLQHLTIPHGQRIWEMDATWNPAYYSPGHGHLGSNDPLEFPPSPSSARYHFMAGEFSDRVLDDHARLAAGHQIHQYSHHTPPPVDNMVWLPVGTAVQEKAGFPNNLGHQHSATEGNSVCENCRTTFQRKQGVLPEMRYTEPHWKHGQSYLDQANMANDYTAHMGNDYTPCFSNSCVQCHRSPYAVNRDLTPDHGFYIKEQREFLRAAYNEPHVHNQGWVPQNHNVGQRFDDSRIQHPGTNRLNEQYFMDGNSVSNPFKQANFHDGHMLPSNCVAHEELQFLRHGIDSRNENLLPRQAAGVGGYTNSQAFDETTNQYVNQSSTPGIDNLYQVAQNLSPISSLRRQAQAQTRPGTPHDVPGVITSNGGLISGYVRYAQDGHAGLPSERIKYDAVMHDLPVQNSFLPPKLFEFEDPTPSDYLHGNGGKTHVPIQGSLIAHATDAVLSDTNNSQLKVPSGIVPVAMAPSNVVSSASSISKKPTECGRDAESRSQVDQNFVELYEHSLAHIEKESHHHSIILSIKHDSSFEADLHELELTDTEGCANKINDAENNGAREDKENSDETLTFLPELIASVQKAVLEGAEEVIAKEQENPEDQFLAHSIKEQSSEHIPENACAEGEAGSDGDGKQENLSKIEPTTAEDEALANGLQTIKNEDLEEIRELGSGTYGSVFYGKWRGSDVAIKRIKASCFAGKPSERARLIADFWKEALLMSKLHHPNIVSFYGVVRDGPDGSLATVTEFMVNGSLKQFLQKKDRTIDRRKRLIIAMDVAFGMEYLHGKNIVHFDLKCENLLVNMRDPHRPICKIGDLGLSKVKKQSLVSGGIRGTLPWMAPELLSGKSSKVSEKIDVYSFGIVMWELLTGEEPYSDMRGASIIGGIINNTLRPKVPTWCDPEWRSLMETCWSSEPALRPSFSEISCKLRKMAAAINLK